MRVLVQHRSRYIYPQPAALGPHVIRLRPASHARARIERYRLSIAQEHRLHWQQDPHGNHIARITFKVGQRVEALDVVVELAVELHPINPFDFFVDDRAKQVPFAYPDGLAAELAPFTSTGDPAYRLGDLARTFSNDLPHDGDAVDLAVELNRAIAARVRYVIRDEAGVWTPEETLAAGRGSCRDSAVLLVALLRSRGLAARFVSGYLIQLADEGMLPDEPRGVDRDVVDLHAWAEVFLPGAGWIGLDATSGLLTGEGHIPLACTATPALAAPLDGTSDVTATSVEFATSIGRIGFEPRPTAPYTDDVWRDLLAAGDTADRSLARHGLAVTVGGEPTFTSREASDLPEWNTDALGDDKLRRGNELAIELRRRLAPGAVLQHRMAKHYPGESLPRWSLDIIARRDGVALWPERELATIDATADVGRRVIDAIAGALGLADVAGHTIVPAFEDPWHVVREESLLPVAVDPRRAGLDDPEERRRLARILDRGVGRIVGWVLPLTRAEDTDAWETERWQLRREHLFLLPGDSPIGLRLPLASLGPGRATPGWGDAPDADDPRIQKKELVDPTVAAPEPKPPDGIRTALCVEPRDGALWVFVPPVARFADFVDLIAALDHARIAIDHELRIEGYAPPPSPDAMRFAVTPDPGVLEVNLPPSATGRDAATTIDVVFDAALATGLHSEKYLLDGRLAGAGGGNHITVGGPTPLESPFLRRPDLLASLITFLQHHPSLSYLFTGLFVGPTSQAPRVDEARHDALYELELALARAFDTPPPEPWLVDALFRHLLVDVAGSTHRAELSIDKLFDPQTPYGRQGLVELRGFEMPPHPRMATAQVLLVRSLVAAFAAEPYNKPLVRWGQELHDRFLLPYYLERDLDDVLAYLAAHDVALPADGYRPFVELRCPLVGRADLGDVAIEIRNAIEPWHVLGEEVTRAGTARFVDSSIERIEVRGHGLVPERHRVAVNGIGLDMRPTARRDVRVGGVRFRAWCPPHALQPHLGIHHPIRIDVVDTWADRSLGACLYHVWHPEGRAFDAPPLTRVEATARRAQRFTRDGGTPWPVRAIDVPPHPDQPYTLDLRRHLVGSPMPSDDEWASDDDRAE